MSAPKKGKDLSALKARLAKKAAAAAPEPEAPAPGEAAVPAPGEASPQIPAPGEVKADIPAPGEVKKPVDIPAPGEVMKPVDIPAPGEVRAPEPESAPAAAAARKQEDIANDPMSGGVAFDPDAGLIADVGGDLKPKSNIGLPIFAGLIGVAIGAGLGWMGHKASDSRARMEAARSKAATIETRIGEIEENRALIAMTVGEAEDALAAKDGEKAATALSALEPTFFELGDLFGWQMAAMDPKIVKMIFDMAEYNNALQLDVGILKAWVGANGKILSTQAIGPKTFVVIGAPGAGMTMAEYVGAVCEPLPEGELPPDFKFESLKPCGEGDNVLTAPVYKVRMEIGGPVSFVPATAAQILNPAGPMYSYAIGANPDSNAKAYYDLQVGKINSVLADMAKMRDDTLEGIGNYTKDPKVSGD